MLPDLLVNPSETKRGKGGGGGEEGVLVSQQPAALDRNPGVPVAHLRLGLLSLISSRVWGGRRDLFFWLGFEEGGKEGQLAGQARGRHKSQDPSLLRAGNELRGHLVHSAHFRGASHGGNRTGPW